MTDIHVPQPIVPQAWAEIDTSIDDEQPNSLSEDQFQQYCETVHRLLSAA